MINSAALLLAGSGSTLWSSSSSLLREDGRCVCVFVHVFICGHKVHTFLRSYQGGKIYLSGVFMVNIYTVCRCLKGFILFLKMNSSSPPSNVPAVGMTSPHHISRHRSGLLIFLHIHKLTIVTHTLRETHMQYLSITLWIITVVFAAEEADCIIHSQIGAVPKDKAQSEPKNSTEFHCLDWGVLHLCRSLHVFLQCQCMLVSMNILQAWGRYTHITCWYLRINRPPRLIAGDVLTAPECREPSAFLGEVITCILLPPWLLPSPSPTISLQIPQGTTTPTIPKMEAPPGLLRSYSLYFRSWFDAQGGNLYKHCVFDLCRLFLTHTLDTNILYTHTVRCRLLHNKSPCNLNMRPMIQFMTWKWKMAEISQMTRKEFEWMKWTRQSEVFRVFDVLSNWAWCWCIS